MDDPNRTNLKIALIMGVAVLAVAFVLYSIWVGYNSKPDPAALQAQALLAEAQAKEYQGQSSLVQAKADLVQAYPDTITAAGHTALQFGQALFLLLLGLGAGWLTFSFGASFIIRSSVNAYRDANAIRVLPQLQAAGPVQSLSAGGSGGRVCVQHQSTAA